MNFSISALGRIPSAAFDIKPLTVFIGKNNTNKTWTAYALYGILRSLTWFMRSGFVPSQLYPKCPQLDSAIQEITERTAKLLVEQAGNTTTTPDPSGAQQSFALEVTRESILHLASLGDQDIALSLGGETLAKILAVEQHVVADSDATLSIESEFFRRNGKVTSLTFSSNRQQPSIEIHWGAPGRSQARAGGFSSLADTLTPEYVSGQIFPYVRWLAFALFGDALGFPAERKAISAYLSLLEPGQRDQKLRAAFNAPSLDFINFLLAARQQRPSSTHVYGWINTLLENEIMGGRVDFEGPTDAKVLSYRSSDGYALQIHSVASLVRSLAGLDMYLKHHTHEVIVIDEPEMNAHPDAQLKLIELFAMLANNGIRIILTTHSPYILDHLNNIVEGDRLSPDAKDAISPYLRLKNGSAFISADKVSAYLFQDDGNVRSVIEDGVIDAGSFAGDSEYVSNLYGRILRAGGAGDGVE